MAWPQKRVIMNNLFNLAKRVAIVTGGNGGIGKEIARGFASRGADVAIVARNARKTEAACNEIREAFGVRCMGMLCDVTDEASVNAMADDIQQELAHIDILVNNAGINIRKMPRDYDAAEWDQVLTGKNLPYPYPRIVLSLFS